MNIITPPPPPALVVPKVGTDISAYIERYIKIRDKKDEIKKRHQEELKPFNDALYVIEQGFLDHLNGSNSDNAVAKNVGTAYRQSKPSAKIEDASTFRRHVIGSEAWHLVDWRANANAIQEAMVETSEPVPGIRFAVETYVNIRRA
ncbi:hypothetical protein PQI07_22635 [Methylobacterium sp. 092160098-2]|uniref:hypothetical protein n=1 Tax=Methylobacterium sp. 092160098-2 TaxID=3025129 RepID=UPI002381A857|nr:hypothetical protein [Methylobacterium sp. 092160098-2]MDE4913481.1 hypothetical protein [Methylobacterium sp. 092160098-2]